MDNALSFLVKMKTTFQISTVCLFTFSILGMPLASSESHTPKKVDQVTIVQNLSMKSLLQSLSTNADARDFFCAYTRKEVDSCATAHNLSVFA